jgi:uncharacterized membrane protein
MSSLPVLIFVCKPTTSRVQALLRKIAHFVLTGGIVFSLLIYFGWMDTKNVVFIILSFLCVYIPLYIVQEIRDKKTAAQINERINATHNGENETHDK